MNSGEWENRRPVSAVDDGPLPTGKNQNVETHGITRFVSGIIINKHTFGSNINHSMHSWH